MQAYEGLETAKTLREEYVFIPAKVRELYLAHMLETLEEQKIRYPCLLWTPHILVACFCQVWARAWPVPCVLAGAPCCMPVHHEKRCHAGA